MSRKHMIVGLAILIFLALGLSYAGWKLKSTSEEAICQACGRTIHANMRAVAVVGGKREVFCCPTCALSEAAQEHASIRFEQLADYETGRHLRPADAFAVEGSDVIACYRPQRVLNPEGQPMALNYDRCSPSILSFASRAAADQFAAQHGGTVGTFEELTLRKTASAAK